jgi:hypothetical protein
VSSRALVLVGLAAAVLVAVVYLFVQVHAGPAEAQIAPRSQTQAGPERGEEVAVTNPTAPGSTPHMGKPLDRPMAASDIHPASLPAANSDDAPVLGDVPDKADPRFQMILAEANKAYDRGDFDEARAIANKVLAKDPKNVRMLRILVSSHCIEGDAVAAQTDYDKLPESDRMAMAKRCSTYGVTFKEPVQ